jgi:hypothetical protein
MSFVAAATAIGFSGVGATIAAGAMMGGATTIAGNVIGGRSAFDNIGRGIITGGITGGLAPGVSEMTGFGIPASAGLIQGGLTTLATGSLSRGLMAGMGAYGMYGLAEGIAGAGTNSLTESYLGDYQSTLAERGIELGSPEYGEAARKMVTDARASIPIGEKMSAGFDVIKDKPGAFFKDNLKYIGAAAAPIMADMMVPTTTKMPEATDTGYIRQKVYDPGTQTYRSLTPIKANEFKDRSFSDIYRGYNGGGIVALAAGGTGKTVADLYADIGRTPDAEGQKFWESAFGTGPVTADQAASFTQSANSVIGAETKSALEDAYARNDVGSINKLIADNRITAQNIGDTWKGFDTSGIAGLQLYTPPTATATDTTGGLNNLATANNITNVTGGGGNNVVTNNTAGTNLAAFNNSYTGANINDYIANNNLDAAGITAAGIKFNVDPAQIVAAQNAQNIVTNVYRNVLGRDPDPAGLSWWTNQIMNGDRTGEEMYAEFLNSAKGILTEKGGKELGKWDMSLADASKDFTGYQSADKRNIADEWVRNTLGREVTEADRKTAWYKAASDSSDMKTYSRAEDIYSDFKDFAKTNASTTVAQQIKDATALLKSKGLSEADVLRQTGSTIADLVGSGMNLENDLFQASQLKAPGQKAGFDFNTITPLVIKRKIDTLVGGTGNDTIVGGTGNDTVASGFYGNKTNPGDLTRNADGTVTVHPNIPYRPDGGFSGIGEVKDAYVQGGGSLGYTSRVVNSADQHDELYNRFTSGGDSEAAYNFLMGKGGAKYPTKSRVGEIARPYREATMGYPTSTNKAYNYDAATGKMVRNPDYVAPSRDAKGNVNYTMSLNEMKKYLTTNPLSGQALYDWAQENGASAQDIADATGRKLSEVYAEFRDAAKKTATDKKTAETASTTTTEEIPAGANGGMMSYAMGGYAVGGGLGSLGGYSDGGRLLKGPGDGVSDSIPATIGRKQQPARLADGEFVVPARIVSELGNGSTEAGAKKLYAMMDRVQRARGKTTGKNKVAANSRADKYLPA